MMRIAHLVVGATLLTAVSLVGAEPTSVDVLVLSRGAKFVGSGVGGVQITLSDAATGQTLAQGITEGGTGDTDLIMGKRTRDESAVTDSAARFSATLDLTAPRRVKVSAHGPLDYAQSANTVTATQWLIPGNARPQRWILELPGLIVNVHDTPALATLEDGQARVPVQVTVRMMCGCPLTPNGLWDSNQLDVEALVMLDDVEMTRAPLSYAGADSEFEGELLLTQPGTYRLSVRAHQPPNGNSGLFEQTLVVSQ